MVKVKCEKAKVANSPEQGGRQEMKRKGIDWYKFFIYFACAAPLGAIAGLAIVGIDNGSTRSCTFGAIVGGMIFGLLSAIYGDRFWEWVIENSRFP